MTEYRKGDVCSLEVTFLRDAGNDVAVVEHPNGEWIEARYCDLTLIRRAPVDLATCELPVEVIKPSGDRGVLDARGGCWGLVKSNGGRHAPWLLSDLRPIDAPTPATGACAAGVAPTPESEVEMLRARVAQQVAGMSTAHLALLGGTKREVVAELLSKYIVRDEATSPTCPPGHIMIGDRAVPEPMRVAPAIGDLYWVAFPTYAPFVVCRTWNAVSSEQTQLERGLIHATEANARAHAEAIIALSAGEGV